MGQVWVTVLSDNLLRAMAPIDKTLLGLLALVDKILLRALALIDKNLLGALAPMDKTLLRALLLVDKTHAPWLLSVMLCSGPDNGSSILSDLLFGLVLDCSLFLFASVLFPCLPISW